MTRCKTVILAAALATVAAPALAGGYAFELKHLTFPAPKPTISDQSCASPTALNTPSCTAK